MSVSESRAEHIEAPQWEPQERDGGWRAVLGAIVDGKLWDSRETCLVYCWGMAQGWRDAKAGWPQ